MSTFGETIKISLFGESHGEAIGITIHNFPHGIKIDKDQIDSYLSRRRPKDKLSTTRVETDQYHILSGVFQGFTTGAPLTFIIDNNNTNSNNYDNDLLRPSHSDLTAYKKYNGYNDYRGSGHFSGRLTAPLMILGSLCDQLLKMSDTKVFSHIYSIKNIRSTSLLNTHITNDTYKNLITSDFPVINNDVSHKMKTEITNALDNGDSVGGSIETIIINPPVSIGEPFFDSVESVISHLIFSIPAVKGIEFGKGFDITEDFGSEANDEIKVVKGSIKTLSNNSGGVNGGITNGMPIVFKTAIKPTPSINIEQRTVSINKMENALIKIVGRHDPCIVQRALPVINALTSYALIELLYRKEGNIWTK
ncbi:chorismate synthase [Candidatus Izimaplasma bacterium ZiA1]|uniref:chorismate synthase n=1 Tax=Candidatus Izimoplasma sp. ZiA1 TaxID=2024899 RepID=UPI000BAA53FD|nr:chorismate synthase [Candidatus Izimaplasma bacterium ZiA1]